MKVEGILSLGKGNRVREKEQRGPRGDEKDQNVLHTYGGNPVFSFSLPPYFKLPNTRVYIALHSLSIYKLLGFFRSLFFVWS